MKNVNLDEIILWTFGGRTGRFNYFLSLIIVIVGNYYLDVFCFSERCLVCSPIMTFPWKDMIELFVFMALLGVYSCILICLIDYEYGFSLLPVSLPILLTVFFIIQTIKRCHDVDRSGWRFLIPIYSPLLLLFLPKELDLDEEPVRTSIWSTLWQSKWLILSLLFLCFFIIFENQRYIHMHHAL